MNSLFTNLPKKLPEEVIEKIAGNEDVRIERIVSHGHCSEEGFWYDQDGDEFVLLLSGQAIVEFEDDEKSLKPGEYLTIASHQKHRVKWTAEDEPTIWLAVHYGDHSGVLDEKGKSAFSSGSKKRFQ